ncbi:RsmB/NOP family class I SAM-dependent RNA methyltransferase [Tabrizicola sp.]|uniref:RsmB/NOP family class I SAM-dependent RNA methyltransferase n=1 Tax=Tabrizicola sp. TaxID=2005166 RepID=UPI003D29EA0A
MTQGKTPKTTPRGAAVALLNAVLGEGLMLAEALHLPEFASLPPADRARAQRLALGVLRVLEPADKVLHPLMRKAPPLPVWNILRLAIVELSGGAAAHGVVNEAVGLARANRKTSHLAGLINAVLRQVPVGVALTSVQKLPRWLRQPLVHAYGREAVTAIEAVQAQTPPLDLTFRAGAETPEGDLLPTGSLRLADKGQVSTLPGYAAGGWWVQDAAAAMAVPLLGDITGQRVLDLCAAPGGKTMQLAAAGADVTAVDISGPRMARVAENLARTGLAATCITADALTWQPDQPFDAIVLDAPCSATGTIRRHPDLPFVKDGSEIEGLVTLQAALLDRALGWLKPGGRLVFVTCSLLPDEGEAQLTAALARHPGLTVQRPTLSGIAAEWITPDGALRLRPDYWADKGGMDGFFMACLKTP